ncbi:MAG: hypothetical protein KDE32_06965 [Novosphingobium sp.]|nr:hypothetical protein [Novosphingobium sp.]
MSTQQSAYPEFPPGFWRRIVLQPGQGWIGGAIEDDMHNFRLRFDHADGMIVGAEGSAIRHPWTGCGGAPDHMVKRTVGCALAEVAGRDPKEHCTHLFDLAALMAAHAHDTGPLTFDIKVGDPVEGRTTATLTRNGEEHLHLLIDGSVIAAPDAYAGLSLRQLSQWKHDLPPEIAEEMSVLRRAVYVSSARQYTMKVGLEGPKSPLAVHAPCFNYRTPVIEETRSLYEVRDFSTGDSEPLEDLVPLRDFASLA